MLGECCARSSFQVKSTNTAVLCNTGALGTGLLLLRHRLGPVDRHVHTLELALLELPVVHVRAAEPVPEVAERAAVVAMVPVPVMEVVPEVHATVSSALTSRCQRSNTEQHSPVSPTLPSKQPKRRPWEVVSAVRIKSLQLPDHQPQPKRGVVHGEEEGAGL